MPIQLEKPDFLESGERARLIPGGADVCRERKITSVLTAALMSVEEFGKGMLGVVGAPVAKTSKIMSYTEVVFKGAKDDKKSRPDGLIILKTGNKSWSALIEAKIGNNELDQAQVEEYLDLAKRFGVDAVITISNQSSAIPSHHPIKVAPAKTRTVGLYHWSWGLLVTEALLWVTNKGVSDRDQSYILEELIRFLQDSSSGVLTMMKVHPDWKDLCQTVQNDAPFVKNSQPLNNCIGSWHQLGRDMSLKMSVAVGKNVSIQMKRAHRDDPTKRLQDDYDYFVSSKKMEVELAIPDAAAPMKVCADFQRKTLTASMYLHAPQDRATAKGRVNWIFRQLDKCQDDTILIKTVWPGRELDTFITLAKLKQDGIEAALATQRDSKTVPVGFEVQYKNDLGVRFKGQRTFVEEVDRILPHFYKNVGQNLSAWVANAPKMQIEAPKAVLEGTKVEDIIPEVKFEVKENV